MPPPPPPAAGARVPAGKRAVSSSQCYLDPSGGLLAEGWGSGRRQPRSVARACGVRQVIWQCATCLINQSMSQRGPSTKATPRRDCYAFGCAFKRFFRPAGVSSRVSASVPQPLAAEACG